MPAVVRARLQNGVAHIFHLHAFRELESQGHLNLELQELPNAVVVSLLQLDDVADGERRPSADEMHNPTFFQATEGAEVCEGGIGLARQLRRDLADPLLQRDMQGVHVGGVLDASVDDVHQSHSAAFVFVVDLAVSALLGRRDPQRQRAVRRSTGADHGRPFRHGWRREEVCSLGNLPAQDSFGTNGCKHDKVWATLKDDMPQYAYVCKHIIPALSETWPTHTPHE